MYCACLVSSYLVAVEKVFFSVLIWWKDHSKTFHVLLALDKDYIVSSSSSCAAEQRFSSAADVCSSCCVILKTQTIERCESFRRLKNFSSITLISLKKLLKNSSVFIFHLSSFTFFTLLKKMFNIYILFINFLLLILFFSSINHKTILLQYHYLVILLLAEVKPTFSVGEAEATLKVSVADTQATLQKYLYE
ncbi:hypothetical protein VP01_444g5 [Puccinia sorghi]|uniref:HAT C-terminal dimerisation domain-containing protein n=1 Tax=Puccinia sorghi TaxID=27349 RepID=A0A0L6UPD7_9BASI|nr:hypothetical protein VP01_444g5 [Puccinia sorghi]